MKLYLLARLLLLGFTLSSFLPPAAFSQTTQRSVNHIAYSSPAFDRTPAGYLGVCSFNIKWLGHYKSRANEALAQLLAPCDAVVVQEMVAPPWDVEVSGGTEVLKGDKESLDFVNAMRKIGFDGAWLSDEDTGPSRNHTNTPASEWFILFYRSSVLKEARDLPHGFLSQPLALNSTFDRVPYAFALRSTSTEQNDGGIDFTIVAVHLHASSSSKEPLINSKVKRLGEFSAIASWIETQKSETGEKDYFVVGDTNIDDASEVAGIIGRPDQKLSAALAATRPDLLSENNLRILQQYISLNMFYSGKNELTVFGTNLEHTKPFDHVFYSPTNTTLSVDSSFYILDLAATFSSKISPTDRTFVTVYSDHDPVKFQLRLTKDSD